MQKLVLATGNEGKVREFRSALRRLELELVSTGELGLGPGPEETGSTYEENALLKAAQAAHVSKLPALADDSGLEVDALDGAPGLYSARFGGTLSDGERNAHLLQKLRKVPTEERGASFVCVLVLATPQGNVKSFTGRCRGVILEGPRGERGHGYDPIFWNSDLESTFAQASELQKQVVSHRGRAVAKLLDWFASPDCWFASPAKT